MVSSILDEIVAYKREFLADQIVQVPFEDIAELAEASPEPPSFFEGLADGDDIAIITEVKKASPSKGLIRADFDPVAIAETYELNGSSALSVLTDEKFFQGSADYLTQISNTVKLPILRKDFTIDPYQIYEARAIGAAAILLIVAILTPEELRDYLVLCQQLDLDALVEVHTEEELVMALDVGAEIVGINNRNLNTFEVSLETTFSFIDRMPDEVLKVSESGIYTRDDVVQLREAGADAVLVGESLMREADIGQKLRELTGDV
ncbi:MAG: indole-3-glycerol phosphate synthase TrpC [Candidatus Latescibacteria bacterium]|jgi:indole-3-glycerol phosphate synthase|nr:indole-3-glycerol phosphate synthase TrpC [Candidatus Latescibacterota bacterium]